MNIKGLLALAGVTLALALGAGRVEAQGGGFGGGGGGGGGFGGPGGGRGFDPSQLRDTMLQNARDQLEVKDDAEWKVIGDQVSKVLDAQQGAINGSAKILTLLRRNNNNGNGNGNGGFGNGNGNGGGQNAGQARRAGGMGGLFGAASTPEDEALQSAIDRGASPAELKTAIQKVEAVRKQKQDALDKAHADLRALLTPRQEAIAITLGLL
jgi:hypothetical protein